MQIEGILSEAVFIRRLNRFEAIVYIDGEDQLAHVPNTGRLKELLVEGAEVIVRKYDNPMRKTRYGLLFVRKDRIWVSIDSSNVPNAIVHEALRQKRFEKFKGYGEIRREVSIYSSRFDFGLFSEEQNCFIEVKGVTLVTDRLACFPDAPTLRGTRHLEELTHLRQSGFGAGVVFIVQREDADYIIPNDKTDRAFGDALRKAEEAGVELYAYTCKIDIQGRQINIDRQIPIFTQSPDIGYHKHTVH